MVSTMARKKNVYVAIFGYQGIVNSVGVFEREEDAMKALSKHLRNANLSEWPGATQAERWFAALEKTNYFPDEDYEPTNLFVTKLQ